MPKLRAGPEEVKGQSSPAFFVKKYGSRGRVRDPQRRRMKKCFIAGCGFVGLATAHRLVAAGWEVIGGVHSAESAEALRGSGFPVVACDITDRASVRTLPTVDAVLHCASSSRGGADAYRSVYLEGARVLLEVFAPARFVFTSSTSVYAQTDGSEVLETSPAEPDRETGQVLRETEELVLAQSGAVARIAGIYGPGRSVLLRKFLAGEAVIEGDGQRLINQAHRDDIASALALLLEREERGIFNVVDNEPMPQRAVYEWLAAHFQKPMPPTGPIDPNRKRGWTNKRVSNARLRALGWSPRYPSFFDAVAQDPTLISGAVKPH